MGRIVPRTLAAVAAGAGALAALVSGCNPFAHHFSTADEGRAYLLERLEQKYGMPFDVADGQFGDEAVTYYSGQVAPTDRPDQQAGARITTYGMLTDDWAVWLFADRLMAVPLDACARAAGVTASCDVRPRMPNTTKTWTPDTPIDTFVAEAKPRVHVQAEFVATDADELAPQIAALAGDLAAAPYPWTLYVTQGVGNVVFHLHSGDAVPSVADIRGRLH